MWSVGKSFHEKEDAYLVISFVGQIRVLGVSVTQEEEEDATNQNNEDVVKDEEDDEEDEVGGTLEEVCIPGLESSASMLGTNILVLLVLKFLVHKIYGVSVNHIIKRKTLI